MSKKKSISVISLILSVVSLVSCIEAKYDDIDNQLRYEKQKGEGYYQITEILNTLPETATIKGYIDDVPVNGFSKKINEDRVVYGGVKHLTFEKSEEFNGTVPFYSLIDVTLGEKTEYNINLSASNLRTIDVGSADLTISFYSERKVNFNLDGGSLKTYTGFGIAKIKAGSIIESFDTSKKSVEEGGIVNKTAVFEEGYDFSDEIYCRNKYSWDNGKIFSNAVEIYYLPIAQTIYLPKSITYICDRFFGNTLVEDNLTIHYAGTEDEWNKIKISDENNGNLKSATIVYNSIYTE